MPLDFREEVERARADRRGGHLSLMAEEAESFDWAIAGVDGGTRSENGYGQQRASENGRGCD